jgi:hypothetical protein
LTASDALAMPKDDPQKLSHGSRSHMPGRCCILGPWACSSTRRAIRKTADHAARAAALGQAVAALYGISLEHGTYKLGFEVVDTRTDFRLKAWRQPPRP